MQSPTIFFPCLLEIEENKPKTMLYSLYFFSFISFICTPKLTFYNKKFDIMLFMIFAASLILLELDLLLRETAASSSALIAKKLVLFLSFRFSQINCRPVAKIATDGKRKGKSAASSRWRDFWGVSWLS